jgi:hypothetical protein
VTDIRRSFAAFRLKGDATWPIARGRERRLTCAAERLPTSGHLGRSSFSGDYRLRPAPCGDFKLILVRDLRGMKKAGGRYVKYYADLQDFYGSDGTRTRDLRRDSPVMVVPG